MKAEASLGYSKHEMVELKIVCRGGNAAMRTRTLNFQRANFSLFRDQLSGISWVRALKEKGVQKAGQYSHHFLESSAFL